MSDRDMLRCGLVLFAAATLLLVACPRREPRLCGPQDACPRGFACSDGVCIEDREEPQPDACVAEYAVVNGECRLACDEPVSYPSDAACCEAHPEACDDVIDRCPSSPPSGEQVFVTLVDLTCEYGEECCCGVCKPSKICSGFAGEELGCFFTDWCLDPTCADP